MVELAAALSLGLSIGSLGMWWLMDRRLQTAREERDRAIDMPNILAQRAPVTAVVRAEMEKQENRERKAMQDGESLFGELLQDEVGDEPDDERSANAPAGVDRSLLEN